MRRTIFLLAPSIALLAAGPSLTTERVKESPLTSSDGEVEFLMRSDDYGNARESFELPEGAYPVVELPLRVRALDFSGKRTRTFSLLLEDGTTVSVEATLEGRETRETPDGPLATERIRLAYGGDFRSIVSRRAEREETYWRAAEGDRVLVAMASESYRMNLVERVRSSYWRENLFSKLRHVTTRP